MKSYVSKDERCLVNLPTYDSEVAVRIWTLLNPWILSGSSVKNTWPFCPPRHNGTEKALGRTNSNPAQLYSNISRMPCPHGNAWLYFHDQHPRAKQIPTAGVTLGSLWQKRSWTRHISPGLNSVWRPLCIVESYWLLCLNWTALILPSGSTAQIGIYEAGLLLDKITLKRCSFIRSRLNMANVKETVVLEELAHHCERRHKPQRGFAQVSNWKHGHPWSYSTT